MKTTRHANFKRTNYSHNVSFLQPISVHSIVYTYSLHPLAIGIKWRPARHGMAKPPWHLFRMFCVARPRLTAALVERTQCVSQPNKITSPLSNHPFSIVTLWTDIVILDIWLNVFFTGLSIQFFWNNPLVFFYTLTKNREKPMVAFCRLLHFY